MPAKSSAAERLRPTIWDALVVIGVLAAALLLLPVLRPKTGGRLRAEISLDSAVIASYDLDRLTEPQSLTVDAPYPLVVEAEPGRIRIAESACPGGDCVHTGWADRAGDRIICLPNRLVITLSGEADLEFDAVSG